MRNHSCAMPADTLDLSAAVMLISCPFRRVTWLNTSAFALYLIPTALKSLLGKGSHDASHHGAYTALSHAITHVGFLTLESYHRATREWVREIDRRSNATERRYRCATIIICIPKGSP